MLTRLVIWILQLIGFDPRGIFNFWNGRRWVRIDPMVAYRRYLSVKVSFNDIPGGRPIEQLFDYNAAAAMIGSGDPKKIQEGYRLMTEAAQKIFEIEDLENGGITETESEQLLRRFIVYVDGVKKNGSGLLTTQTNSVSTGESLTNNDSAVTSISTGNLFEMPDVSGLDLQQEGDLMRLS